MGKREALLALLLTSCNQAPTQEVKSTGGVEQTLAQSCESNPTNSKLK